MLLFSDSEDETLPKFTWDITDKTNMTSGPFMLNVEFHDGMKDVAILFPSVYNDNGKDVIYTSILNGDLTNEDPVVEVSVNGNPGDNTFDVKRRYQILITIFYFNKTKVYLF